MSGSPWPNRSMSWVGRTLESYQRSKSSAPFKMNLSITGEMLNR